MLLYICDSWYCSIAPYSSGHSLSQLSQPRIHRQALSSTPQQCPDHLTFGWAVTITFSGLMTFIRSTFLNTTSSLLLLELVQILPPYDAWIEHVRISHLIKSPLIETLDLQPPWSLLLRLLNHQFPLHPAANFVSAHGSGHCALIATSEYFALNFLLV